MAKIYFNNGTVWDGEILEETESYVKIRSDKISNPVTIFKRLISKIE